MKTTELKKGFQDGKYEELLRDIYIDESVLDYQKERYIKAIESFEELFGEKEVEIYSAPGRSEIGGNHTDHQLGRVLAASINLDAIAIVAKKENGVVLKSEGYPMINVSLADLLPKKEEEGTSEGLIRGVAAKLKEEGYEIGGFEAYVTSDVLNGAGMSSSAAFEVLTGNILSGLYNCGTVSATEIAIIGQYAENVYFGKPCGLMDQMASSVGNIITIDFADKANPDVEPVQVDFSKAGLALCILDSGADHADLTDEYAAIPNECRAVAAVCGGEVLRDVPFETFLAKLPECRKQCGDRAVLRAFHFYADNDRVPQQVAALREGDFDAFLQMVTASGDSSWEYLQNVIPAGYKEHQEVAVTIAAAKHYLGGKGAVRVHGGGFAGTVQAFVPVEMLADFKANMEKILGAGRCHVLSIRPEGGAVL